MSLKTDILLKLSNIADGLITGAKLNTSGASSGDVITYNGTNVVWDAPAGGGGSLIPLTTTFADCENTTSEIDIITVTIPANTLAVGDIINIEGNFIRLQNSGGAVSLDQRYYINATAVGPTTTSISNSATTGYIVQMLTIFIESVSGNNLTFRLYGPGSNSSTISKTQNIGLATTLAAGGYTLAINTVGSIDKTATITIKVSADWASANANTYIRTQQAQAYIIKKAV